MLRLEVAGATTSVPLCLLQLLRDLTLLERDVNDFRGPSSYAIERILFRTAEFEQPMPYAPEWYAIYQYARNLFERAASDGFSPSIRDAFLRVAQFVLENEDLA